MNTPEKAADPNHPIQPGEVDHIEVLGYEKIKDRGWWSGRAGLVVPLLMCAAGVFMLIGQFTMDVPDNADNPGPQFFPWLIITALFVLAVVLTVEIVRKPEMPELAPATTPEDLKERAWYTDWRALTWALSGLVLFTALIEPVGWILAAGLLFVMIARSVGSRKLVLDILIGLFMSSAVYLIFAVLLSVDLPAGLVFSGGR